VCTRSLGETVLVIVRPGFRIEKEGRAAVDVVDEASLL
jgi:hypothetical protein